MNQLMDQIVIPGAAKSKSGGVKSFGSCSQVLVIVALGLFATKFQELEQLPPRGNCLEIIDQACEARIHATPTAVIAREKARRYGEAQP